MVGSGIALPLNKAFQHSLFIKRLKRDAPTGNVYDPPLPVFPSKENAPFWNPAPYPFPTTIAPPPAQRHRLPYYDPNNPYLDAMTNGYWPNFGLGYANQNPTQIGGGINWPTGNALMPSDHFNGTLGFARPEQLRIGMQGGPFFPYQNPQYIKTVKDVNDANMLNQITQTQADSRTLGSVSNAQGAPSGFIPVQQQMFAQPQQQSQLQPQPQVQQSFVPQQQQQFFPRSQQVQALPNHRQMSFSSVPNPSVS